MSTGADKIKRRTAEQTEAIPEIRPWCEVGWIFRDGDARAIERQDDRSKVHDQRDE
jgi:hypothetical protein